MDLRLLVVLTAIALVVGVGCASTPPDRHVEEIQYEQGKLQKFSYLDETSGGKGNSSNFVAAIDTLKQVDPMALPELQDLPVPGLSNKTARAFTGVIKNQTKFEVSIPSKNSGATLVIPPHGWIEYTTWTQYSEVTAFHNGKPFYCLKLCANPREYAFMCKKYDFVAEIVKPEPVRKQKPVRKKPRLKKKPKGDEGVEALG
jgi:hypothetical protein